MLKSLFLLNLLVTDPIPLSDPKTSFLLSLYEPTSLIWIRTNSQMLGPEDLLFRPSQYKEDWNLDFFHFFRQT